DALGCLAPGPLDRVGHALLAQQGAGSLDVAAGLLERALAVHHPGPGEVAKLLDEPCRDGHSSPPGACSGSAEGSESAVAVGSSTSGGGSAASAPGDSSAPVGGASAG